MHRMHEPIDIDKINLTYYCRGCHQKVRGIPLTSPQYHISAFHDDPWIICRCPTHLCELSFVIYDKLNDRVSRVYPLPNFEPDNYHKAIPAKVREDLAEADRCWHAYAYKAAVCMNRRAIQRIVLDKIKDKSVKDKKLYEQIDELYNAGFITKHLKETADEIRHFGNFGAHPSDDKLDNTTQDEAKIVDNLTWDIVKTIYITPYQTDKLKSKRVTLKNYKKFLNKLFEKLEELEIDVSGLQLDHIAYYTETNKEYDDIKPDFESLGNFDHEAIISNRRVGVVELFEPLVYGEYKIDAIELIEPKEGEKHTSGWEHAEFVTDRDYNEILKDYPAVEWETGSIERPIYSHLTAILDKDLKVKFHHNSILECIAMEQNQKS